MGFDILLVLRYTGFTARKEIYLELLSFGWGVVSTVGMAVAIVPFMGWLNWVIIPFAVAGLIISIVASIISKRAKWFSRIGVILCAIAIIIGALRLIAGRGLI